MPKGKGFPAWLVRRGYFRRIERWAKPGGAVRVAPEPEATNRPSNILPFPERPAAFRRADLQQAGSA